jgi:hypothetical protein
MSARACATEKIGSSRLLPLHILEAAILNFDRIFIRVLACFPEFPRVGLSHGGRRRRRVLGRAGVANRSCHAPFRCCRRKRPYYFRSF